MRYTWLRSAVYDQARAGMQFCWTQERWSHTVSAAVRGVLSYVQDSGHVRSPSLVLETACTVHCVRHLRMATARHSMQTCRVKNTSKTLVRANLSVQERWHDSEQILRGAISRCSAGESHDLLALTAALAEIKVLQRNWRDALTVVTDVAGTTNISTQHTPASINCLRLTAAAEAAMVRPATSGTMTKRDFDRFHCQRCLRWT